ncbi:MAG: thiamine diphosphokinase [Burkholderiales bacterium]|jgi:thiamine pyrophosphokinase|nr:thiamine diphosphokinase [Burkholderiales bacterium]
MSGDLEAIFKQCINLARPVNIIIANGEPPKDRYLYKLLNDANTLICCDGAIGTLEQNNIVPDCIIGDCDSLSEAQKQKYVDKIKYTPDQNFNDLTKAVDFAINQLQLDNIIIMGATGLREDHSLANISLLVEYAKKIKNIILLSDYGFFRVYAGSVIIPTVTGQQISLFSIYPEAKITTHGLKWDLSNLALESWHKGTLNEALSTQFAINTTKPILVYQTF